MILSNLSQQFIIHIGHNFFYPEVRDKWFPLMKRMSLPYLTLEDFFNAQIQAVEFPGLNLPEVTQNLGRYHLAKRNAFQERERIQKDVNVTVKLTESYISYFIIRQQMELFFQLGKEVQGQRLYWDPLEIDFLDDQGHVIISYSESEITPVSISSLSLSYAARLGTYNTFTFAGKFNFFDIWYYEDNEKIKLGRV